MKVKSLSRVRLLATPWTAAFQTPPSMGFSRQEYWSGVPWPSPMSQHSPKYLQIVPALGSLDKNFFFILQWYKNDTDSAEIVLPVFTIFDLFQGDM